MIERITNGIVLTGRTLGYLSAEVRGIHAAAYVLGASALLSSLLALLRDRLLAHTFGAGIELDLYYAAFRIPDLLFVALGALVSVYVLIPALAARGEEDQRAYIDSIILGFSFVAGIAGILAFILSPSILSVFFPHLFVTQGSMLILLTRILLLQPILLGLSNIAAAITQYKHRYPLYAVTPIVYNLGIIGGIVFLYPQFGFPGLVSGVVCGALLHLGIQLPSTYADGFFRRVSKFDAKTFFETIRISIPRALSLSIVQLTFLGLIAFAGRLAAGSISVLMFAYNLQAVPLSIIGASYSVAAFPTLAASLSRGEREQFLVSLHVAARQILFWSLPAFSLVVVLRAHIVRVVLGSGAFDWTDTRLTAAALALFIVSLVAQGLSLLIIRACYAAGKTLAPLVIAAITGGTTIILSIVFMQMFQHADTAVFLQTLLRVDNVPGSDMLALVLAYSTAAIIGTLLLIGYFELRLGSFFSDVARAWWHGITAAFVGGLVAYTTLYVLGDITLASTLASILLKGFAAGSMGLVAVAVTYFLLGSREFAEAVLTLRRRLWREVEPVSSAEQSA